MALAVLTPAKADTNYRTYSVYALKNLSTKTTGATNIFTTENGTKNFHAVVASFKAVTSTSIIIPATASIGTNSPGYNNVMGSTLLAGLLNAGFHFPVPFTSVSVVIPPNTDVYINVLTTSTGTSQTANVRVTGYYM